MTTQTTKTNKTTQDDYGDTISFFALKDEPVWKNGFEFFPYRAGMTEFAHRSNTYGKWGLIKI